MLSGTWWVADVAAVIAHSYALGYYRPSKGLTDFEYWPILLALALEGIVVVLGDAALGAMSLVVVVGAVTLGALVRGPSMSGLAATQTETVLFAALQSVAYLTCRRMATAVTYTGFPSGTFLSVGTLSVFFLAGMAVIYSCSDSDVEKKTRHWVRVAFVFLGTEFVVLLTYALMWTLPRPLLPPPTRTWLELAFAFLGAVVCFGIAVTVKVVKQEREEARARKVL